MDKKVAVKSRKQEKNDASLTASLQQMILPLIIGAEATRQGLFAFAHQIGMAAVQELFARDAQTLVGPKGKHVRERSCNHWGTTQTPFPFAGREVVLPRPRVRRKGGGEVPLPTVEAFLAHD